MHVAIITCKGLCGLCFTKWLRYLWWLSTCSSFDCKITLCRKNIEKCQHWAAEVNISWSPKSCLTGFHCLNVLLTVDYHKLSIWIFKLVQSIRPQSLWNNFSSNLTVMKLKTALKVTPLRCQIINTCLHKFHFQMKPFMRFWKVLHTRIQIRSCMAQNDTV